MRSIGQNTAVLLAGVMILAAGRIPTARAEDEPKVAYAGQVCSRDEYASVVTAKNRTLEIQGGFVTKLSAHVSGVARWATTQTFSVGDTIDMEFHIGVKEAPYKLNTKSFPSPQPVLCLMKDGSEIKQLPLEKGACCSGTMPFAISVTSLMPPGEHFIKANVEYPQGVKLPEKVFKITIVNPDFGKTEADEDAEALKASNPGADVAVLQQGAPVPEWNLSGYTGCADTYLYSANAVADRNMDFINFGGSPELGVGFYGMQSRGLIRFDLSALPKGKTVVKAILKLHLQRGGPLELQAHRVLQPWQQGIGIGDLYDKQRGRIRDGECSWVKRAHPGTAWGEQGCSKAGEDFDAKGVASECKSAKSARQSIGKAWVTWDVTAFVQGWAKDAESNHGVLLAASDKNPRANFRSSDYEDPVYRPKLILVCK